MLRGFYIYMSNNSVVLRFSDVNFAFDRKVIFDEVNFSVRDNSKIALMGQNGAGKSTLFKMITGELKPNEGGVFVTPEDATVAVSKQVMDPKYLDGTVREYFESAFNEKKYELDKLIKDIFEVVNIDIDVTKKVRELSGGQQARMLLAHALIQGPDILLLDEPTNNLDQEGIGHLTAFLVMYPKTCIVISHDAEFLNVFTDGVLYLDAFMRKVEQYTGNYHDVVEEITARVKKEQLLNVRAEKDIKRLKAQAGVFAHKGGKLRSVAKKMREAAAEAEEGKVDVRKEDKTIPKFTIPAQEFEPSFNGKLVEINEVSLIKDGEVKTKKFDYVLRKNIHLLIAGPNGIGKSTFLETLASGDSKSATIAPEVTVGYYRQDFSTLDFNQKAYDSLMDMMTDEQDDQVLRATAARFLLDGSLLDKEIKYLSEGQKGLLSFARLVLQKPGLIILDEPTNHINFRHLPMIAAALDEYKGAMILVSHIPEFVDQIRINEVLDLNSI